LGKETVYMVARNDEMSFPVYTGTFKWCCNFINRRSHRSAINEKEIYKQFNYFVKEVEANDDYIIFQTEIDNEERGENAR